MLAVARIADFDLRKLKIPNGRESLLLLACDIGHTKLVESLLSGGGDSVEDVVSRDGMTAFATALGHTRAEIVSLLLNAGLPPEKALLTDFLVDSEPLMKDDKVSCLRLVGLCCVEFKLT